MDECHNGRTQLWPIIMSFHLMLNMNQMQTMSYFLSYIFCTKKSSELYRTKGEPLSLWINQSKLLILWPLDLCCYFNQPSFPLPYQSKYESISTTPNHPSLPIPSNQIR
ncbi:hypothetical protein SAY86_032175 [Trapa natans]|uniref:Uncharacterized protein n=1 Tax=Trapa natans TaxID=22666 RepID=A0AAN7R6R6_TRANT|nr:hypothetical protein SAY86_032175 [Trapa natans]